MVNTSPRIHARRSGAISEAPDAATTRRRRLAWWCTVLMFVVVAASAFMRHHADVVAGDVAAELIGGIRQLHRLAATLVLIAAVVLLLQARRAGERRALLLASGLLALALLLSVVGVAAGASRSAPVVLVNLLGGYVMLGLCTRLATLRSAPPAHRAQHASARWLIAVLLLQAAAGGWSSANPSVDCHAFANCAWATTLHRGAGLLIGHALLLFGLLVDGPRWRAGRALALVALALLMAGLYGSAVGSQMVPALIVAHNALAALSLVLLVALARP